MFLSHQQTIQELFSVSTEKDASHRMAELLDSSDKTASSTTTTTTTTVLPPSAAAADTSDAATASGPLRPGALENALAAAEDETDVVAARHAMAEVAADLAEFDENIPLNDDLNNSSAALDAQETSKVQLEINKLMQQVSQISVLISQVEQTYNYFCYFSAAVSCLICHLILQLCSAPLHSGYSKYCRT